MKNKMIKKVLLILVMAILIINIPLYSKADNPFDNILNAGNDFISEGQQSTAIGIESSRMEPLSNFISNTLLVIAVGVTLITAAMMAINFTIQSMEEKAKIKEAMVPWIIGIFVTFGAYGIWRITMTVFYGLI